MMLMMVAAMAITAGPQFVEFEGAGGMKLKGTLEMPSASKQPVKALLLLPGSGPTDRDGNQPPALVTDLLKQIAEELARQGVATLRFDKRAAHVYHDQWPKELVVMNEFFSWESFVGDAVAAYRFLGKQASVDPTRVGILGHSEGGMIALQAAFDLPASQKPSTLILVGTPGRNMAEIVREQISAALKAQGAPQSVYDEYMGHTNRAIDQITTSASVPADIPAGLAPLFNASAAKLMQSYFKLDIPALARAYSGPVLVLNGENDAQILAEKDLPVLTSSLKSRAEAKVESKVIEGASHNLKAATTKRDPGFSGQVVEAALKAIVNWMKDLP